MDELTAEKLENIHARLDTIMKMIEVEGEENKKAREETRKEMKGIVTIGNELFKLQTECNVCRDRVNERLGNGMGTFKDHETRLLELEKNTLKKGEKEKARDNFRAWIEFAKSVSWVLGSLGFVFGIVYGLAKLVPVLAKLK